MHEIILKSCRGVEYELLATLRKNPTIIMAGDDICAIAADQLEEYELLFDIQWKASMRAIKMWQAAHPGNDLVWPDKADLCVWLLEQLDQVLNDE